MVKLPKFNYHPLQARSAVQAGEHGRTQEQVKQQPKSQGWAPARSEVTRKICIFSLTFYLSLTEALPLMEGLY